MGVAIRLSLDATTGGSSTSEIDSPEKLSSIQPSILIVDDEPKFRILIGRLLQKRGFNVSHAENGREAIQMVEAGLQVDVIVLDERMPYLTGTETFRYLRSRGVQTPMVLVSAMEDVHTVAEANGFDGALQKPVSVNMLAGLIRALVQLQRDDDGISAGEGGTE